MEEKRCAKSAMETITTVIVTRWQKWTWIKWRNCSCVLIVLRTDMMRNAPGSNGPLFATNVNWTKTLGSFTSTAEIRALLCQSQPWSKYTPVLLISSHLLLFMLRSGRLFAYSPQDGCLQKLYSCCTYSPQDGCLPTHHRNKNGIDCQPKSLLYDKTMYMWSPSTLKLHLKEKWK